MIHARRTLVAAAALFAVVVGSPGPAQAQPVADPVPRAPSADPDGGLPKGWEITGNRSGQQLTWRSTAPVTMGNAAIEFYAGDRFLGRPEGAKDGRTFNLGLAGVRLGKATDLHVKAGGRRLDAAGDTDTSQRRRTKAPPKPSARPPANRVDPGVPGPYGTVSGEYDLKPVKLPGFAAPVEMRAAVVAPTGAPGRRPVALFLHGRHASCFSSEGEHGEMVGGWPCPAGSKPLPSYRGYLHDQKLLASQGYVTVSISANGINAQDDRADDGGAQARSSLVRQHLADWANWSGAGQASAPEIVRKAAKADLSRVLLVGHSRGGEGVNRAAMDSLVKPPADQDGYRGPVSWKIRGTVLIGPTIFGQNPAPDVPSMTILPGCDGDVADLQGEIYVDGTRGVSRGAALHSAVYMVGANHNFFNTEWTPGQAEASAEDDFSDDPENPDAVCKPGTATRLTAKQQQAAGSTYIAAAARVFVAGDDKVRPLLDGSNVRAASAGPARVLTHAVGARRTGGFLPNTPVTVDGGRLCAQVDPDPATACLNPEEPGTSPHFARWEWEVSREPNRNAVALKWSAPGSAVRVKPGRTVSVAGAKDLSLRVIVPPNTTGTRMDVSLTDAAGRQAKLGGISVDGLPGTDRTASYWGQEVRVPLAAATRAGLDLKRVKSLALTPRSGSGQAWLMDAWGWRPGMAEVRPVVMPRVDIGRLQVKEGDSGVRTYQVPVRVSGEGSGRIRLFVAKPGSNDSTSRLVTVRPGSDSVDVPIDVEGNTRYSSGSERNVFAKAVQGAVVGSHRGGVTVENDDPMPTYSATPVADRVTEGKSLTWRITQSAPADSYLWLNSAFVPVGGGAELSTTDLAPDWVEENIGESPTPATPLSEVGSFYLPLEFPAGQVSAEVTIPTVTDTVSEPEESLRIQLSFTKEDGEEAMGPVLTGTVLDAG
ncbi:hypothetical protein [Streptomyces sp. NBC_00878]|uniref:hypothetical protein n=1 Tax=Streptomyces sp. NBC_00878 TaxID=2975854 RepID=UPI00224C8E30|nr:hypothetical protein [Streptomyces sp. NBC_00878]MCX4907728.1 hypothetical protein [Streptomyces sp. NBC_00878]